MDGRGSLIGEVAAGDNLMRAWRQVRRNVAVPVRPFSQGRDGVSVAAFERTLEVELGRLADEIVRGSYAPVPVRWIAIPKPNGGRRTIGILAVRDRVAQRAVHQVLAPRLDDVFLPCSYGFRAGRSGRDAVEALLAYREGGDTWAVLADIEACFDRLDHGLLLGALQRHVGDRRLLRLIEQWLAGGMIGQSDEGRQAGGEPAGAGEGQRQSPWERVQGLARSLAGPHGTPYPPDEYEYATYEQTARRQVGSELLMLGVGLAGPALRRARRVWPVARSLLVSKAGLIGGVGLAAAAVAAPLVWRAISNARRAPGVGVLQGSALSPLLTNLYLHTFDIEMTEAGLHLVRYVDDLAVSCPTEAEARRARWTCSEALGRLRLTVNADKSALVQWSHGFEFLGERLGGC
ncbi:MAG TPA: reverse transcriptase domain-containing protein [Anaerolineae bacterium]|nr:reverse transcriptase domain-containing protein [Anaerolineae bacterium]